jgi:recombination protein RecA
MYNEGISRSGEVLDIGVKEELVHKSGSCYEYNGQKMDRREHEAIPKDNQKSLKILKENQGKYFPEKKN